MLTALCASGQVNVEVVGTSANAAGRHVELLCYDDMLAMSERLLDTATVDSAGRFALGCYLTYPRLVVVQAECYSQSFYAEPGRRYEVWLPEFRWEQDEERNVWLDPVALPLEFLNLPDDELNLKLARFDVAVDSFVAAHRVHLDPRYKPRRAWFDSLEATVRPLYEADADSFYVRYARFTLAQMRYDMRFATRRQLLDGVLGGPVLYHDECYMRALFDVLGGMVSRGMRKVPKRRLVDWVLTGDMARYIDSVGTEPLLYDEQRRELAVLVALKESLYDPDYDPDAVAIMLRQLAAQTKWKEHSRLVERLLQSEPATGGAAGMTGDADGRPASVFDVSLPDADRHMVPLDSLRGKWVYMSFVRVGDPNCLREVETLAHFKDSIYARHDDVVFVSIACDREFQKMYHFLRNNRRGPRYSWTWLHFDGNYRWLERMGVVSYPTFLLFNPEGRLHYTVTPWPESGLLLHGPWEKAPAEREKLEFTD